MRFEDDKKGGTKCRFYMSTSTKLNLPLSEWKKGDETKYGTYLNQKTETHCGIPVFLEDAIEKYFKQFEVKEKDPTPEQLKQIKHEKWMQKHHPPFDPKKFNATKAMESY